MKAVFYSLVFLALAFSPLKADEIEEEGGVLVLTDDNFDGAIKDNEFILVEFYAPWCGHCKSLAPEYEKAATKLKEDGSAIKLAKVDATVEKDLASKFEVKGFPTLKFFKSGNPVDYSGPRESKGIVAWLEKKTGPAAVDLDNVEAITEFADKNEVAVIGLFKKQDSDEAKEFLAVAGEMDDLKFGITSDDAAFKEYKVKGDNAIVVLKKFDEKRADFEGKFEAKDIKTFLQGESIRLVTEFSPETAPKLFGTDVKVHLLFFASKEEDATEKQIEEVTKVAKKNKGKMIFVHVDSAKGDNKQVIDFFGMKPEDAPSYVIYEMEKSAKYIGGKNLDIDEKTLGKFVKDFHAGNLKRTLKSEDLPEDWDAEPVKVLVQKNFAEVALDKKKDVFVEFYAPWCGHCKQLAPKWDELAEKFEDNDEIVIAKMDSTANEIEEVQVQGFPTLKLFRKGTNEIVDYDGAREVEAMAKWLEGGAKDEKKKDKKDEL